MFFQLLYIHLFRPFLKYSQATSPLPPNVSPRRLCTQAATAISKLVRLYKRSHGLRQILNLVVYIIHSACTIHLLNLPDKNAKRDLTHGVKHLEEIAESWLCARRTLAILSVLSRQWKVELPDEAAAVLARTDIKFAAWSRDIQSRYPSKQSSMSPPADQPSQIIQPSPNFFNAMSVSGQNPRLLGTPDALPPGNAPIDLMGRTSATPSGNTMSPPTSQASVESGGSPSAIFGGVDQLLRSDGGDWWVRDQNQLAQGFAQWSPDFESNGLWRPMSMTNQQQLNHSNIAYADEALGRLLAMHQHQGMQYPNENEWYQ